MCSAHSNGPNPSAARRLCLLWPRAQAGRHLFPLPSSSYSPGNCMYEKPSYRSRRTSESQSRRLLRPLSRPLRWACRLSAPRSCRYRPYLHGGRRAWSAECEQQQQQGGRCSGVAAPLRILQLPGAAAHPVHASAQPARQHGAAADAAITKQSGGSLPGAEMREHEAARVDLARKCARLLRGGVGGYGRLLLHACQWGAFECTVLELCKYAALVALMGTA